MNKVLPTTLEVVVLNEQFAEVYVARSSWLLQVLYELLIAQLVRHCQNIEGALIGKSAEELANRSEQVCVLSVTLTILLIRLAIRVSLDWICNSIKGHKDAKLLARHRAANSHTPERAPSFCWSPTSCIMQFNLFQLAGTLKATNLFVWPLFFCIDLFQLVQHLADLLTN